MAAKRKCIGYGSYENICTNVAGTRWTPYWCERCDAIRRDTITKQLEAIRKSFDRPTMVPVIGAIDATGGGGDCGEGAGR